MQAFTLQHLTRYVVELEQSELVSLMFICFSLWRVDFDAGCSELSTRVSEWRAPACG